MKKGDFLSKLLRSDKTVFSFSDIILSWKEMDTSSAIARVSYYVKNSQLIRLRRGLYAKDNDYNKYELATKICIPSYVSFETVLRNAGAIFQWYDSIFIASYKTKEIEIDKQKYCFKTIKPEILTNSLGIINEGNYHIASPERALLDILYLNQDYYFDSLSVFDWEKVHEILPIYNNKRMVKKVEELEILSKQNIK
jgi:hypothetical protein